MAVDHTQCLLAMGQPDPRGCGNPVNGLRQPTAVTTTQAVSSAPLCHRPTFHEVLSRLEAIDAGTCPLVAATTMSGPSVPQQSILQPPAAAAAAATSKPPLPPAPGRPKAPPDDAGAGVQQQRQGRRQSCGHTHAAGLFANRAALSSGRAEGMDWSEVHYERARPPAAFE